ncbi:MAG: T9SS type A sorting domain-containing protein, partial [Cytophagales bacterium]|nr:T9SS type A sorting domain-containing protein [Cytophagales bacterium]
LNTTSNDYFGHFNNYPSSGFRTEDGNKGEIILDILNAQLQFNGKVKFPIYVNAADTASTLDIYWQYDTTKIVIDSVSLDSDGLHPEFIFASNKIGKNTLQISGFNPIGNPFYSNSNILWVTASLTGTGNPFTNTDLSLINGQTAKGVVRIASVTEEFETLYSIKPFLYPNPGDGTLKIGGIKPSSAVSSIQVFNTLGVEVFHSVLMKDSIDLGNLPSGVYYIKLRIGSTDYTLSYTKLSSF